MAEIQQTLFELPAQHYTTDDYYTPKWIFDRLNLTFDLDVSSPQNGPLHTPCHNYYTIQHDGLAQPWHGLVFMNPPFSNTTPWVHRFIEHANGIALLPDLNRTWRNDLYNTADGIVALDARLKFDVPDERRPDIRYSCCLYAYGAQALNALTNANFGRVRL